jgi:hypothetical protein
MFLISLAVSIVLTVIFWNFGVAHRIWPAHPMLATTLVAAIACGSLQVMLSPREKSR